MSKQYHRPPFSEANLVMSAETTKAAKTIADTTQTAGSPKADAHAAQKILFLAKRVLMA
jgi:hypothetical protein